MDDLTLLGRPPRPTTGAAGLVLQRLPLGRDVALRELYVRSADGETAFPARCRAEESRLVAARGAALSFDTYFGAFFEQAWRGPTALRSLALDLRASGSFALRVLRRSAEGEEAALHEEVLRGHEGWLSVPLPAPLVPAAGGRLFAEVTALRGGCAIEALEWRTPDTPLGAPVGLVPVFCTFGRERQLGAVLATLAAEPGSWRDLPRILVVNQGGPGLAAHPAFAALPAAFRARLAVVEQGNFGGAGGFTRGLLAARDVPGATHALLMDDDVAAEPEALRRAAAFFAIARPRHALGGHMLDMLRPTRLYEAGARVDERKLYPMSLRFDMPLGDPRSLDALSRPEPMHYNGWWFFGLPLALLEEAGLPLPCFIRGDDVEYGLRLHEMGAPIVALPGAAIWHEPFYLKLNGWQLYYETRNMLVAAAVHFPRHRLRLAVLLLKRLLIYLLTYRYYGAALVLRAVEDYLRGPAVYEAPPQALHDSLARCRAEFPPEEFARERVPRDRGLLRDPRTPPGFALRLAWSVLRNWALPPGRATTPVRVGYRDLVWFRVALLDRVVVETHLEDRFPVFRRSPAAFRRQLAQGARLLLRVARDGDAAALGWRRAHPRLTGAAFWRSYLGLARDPAEPAAALPAAPRHAPPTAGKGPHP
jgi:galactofuranosylgalactofuranosylrhamnosyl-N-acetylglucosaminyl-diphospho-decaprenol beta-1,5/1,6-galactofuranosyltransferase